MEKKKKIQSVCGNSEKQETHIYWFLVTKQREKNDEITADAIQFTRGDPTEFWWEPTAMVSCMIHGFISRTRVGAWNVFLHIVRQR